MSIRTKLLAILDIVLRVPPVFIIDALLISGFQIPRGVIEREHNETGPIHLGLADLDYDEPYRVNGTVDDSRDDPFYSPHAHPDIIQELGWLSLNFHCILAAAAMFLLSTRHLISIYVWLGSIAMIFWSYIANEQYVKYALTTMKQLDTSIAYELFAFNLSTLVAFVGNYFLQVFLAIFFCFASTSAQNYLPKRLVGVCFILPTVLSLLPNIRESILLFSPLAAASIALFFVALNLTFQVQTIYQTVRGDIIWARNMSRHYGVYTLIENQWNRLHVPQVLRVFWLTRLTEQAIVILADTAHENFVSSGSAFVPLDPNYFFTTAKELLIRGCETVIAVLGMTSILSSLSHHVGCLMQSFLVVEDPEDRSIGTVSAILFFILALQTGLTSMEPEKRFQRLYRNICLLSTAILHFIHNMVSPLLFSLSASRNMSWSRHSRALAVCFFLIAFPSWFLIYLWSTNTISTWLLAVSAFSIEVIIKVIISLLIYALFMIDAFRSSMWERLDDYVYYVRATGNTIEFVFGIFLFFNGAYILLFESGGTIRALMMCIHAYFNIFLQAKTGWKTFIKRRQAVHKINSLPEATPAQLEQFDDVCAICYQELTSARITKCNHYFHGVCLRKWLYVQDICPLCHETLYVMTEDPAAAANNAANQQQDRDQENNVHDNHVNGAEAGEENGDNYEEYDESDGTDYEVDENELRQLMSHEHQD